MNGYGSSWRRLQQELTPVPTVAALHGWRRYSRPIALVTVAAVVSAAIVVFANNKDNTAKATSAAENILTTNQRTVEVNITAQGCATDRPKYPSGQLVVTAVNRNAVALGTVAVLQDGMHVGEREDIAPGMTGSFGVILQPGRYVISCPGTAGEQTTIDVVGARVASSSVDTTQLLAVAGRKYRAYEVAEARQYVTYLRRIIKYARNGQVTAAQCEYAHARAHYDHFSALIGLNIQAEALQEKFKFVGLPLFQLNTTLTVDSMVAKLLPAAKELVTIAEHIPLDSVLISRAALENLTAIFQKEIIGIAEKYSHGDLRDIYERVEGSKAAVDMLRPALVRIDPEFTKQMYSTYKWAATLLSKYRDNSEMGYVQYTTLSDNQKKQIAQAIQAIEVPVSEIPGKLVRQ